MQHLSLVTERCLIRNFTEEDLIDLYEILSDKKVMEFIESPFSLKKFLFRAIL